MIDIQSFAHGFFFVIVTLNQRFSGFIIFSRLFGWIENEMICPSTGKVNPPPAHAFDDFFIGDINVDHRVNRHCGFFHRICLWNGTRKAIK